MNQWSLRNNQLMVRDDLKLPDDGGEIPKSQGRGWRFKLAVKSPLYLTENLLGGQLQHVLWF